ncbi:hypothetical protein, partial [Lactiplantibacillus pentosus]|uniref:hypothetical protein n=1 Tax=Lactiplantibacillus pentosus TaxID=1589 RepID=UPI0040596745
MMQNHSADSPCLEDFFTQIPIAILSKNAKLCQKVVSRLASHFLALRSELGGQGGALAVPLASTAAATNVV